MNDASYINQAELLLSSVEQQCDRLNDEQDCDIDAMRVGDMTRLVFLDQTEIIINLQKPLEEVWLASKYGGYHFRLTNGEWRTQKDDVEFFSKLSEDASLQADQQLIFKRSM